jgi:hypothetical protein
VATHAFHFYHTDIAGSEWFQTVVITKGGYFDTVSPGEFQDSFTGVPLYDIAIEYDVKEFVSHRRKVFYRFW